MSLRTHTAKCSHQDKTPAQSPTANPFLAHVKPTGESQLLSDHLLGVSAITSQLAAKIGMARAGELIGLAHDLGKYSTAFQGYIHNVVGNASMNMEPDFSLKGTVDHSSSGAQIIADLLPGAGGEDGKFAAGVLALCVASHHSGLIDCILPDGQDGLTRRLDKSDDLTHRSEVWGNVEGEIRVRLESLLGETEAVTELTTAMERIRVTDNDEVIQPFKQGLLLRLLFSCLIDGDRTDTADFDKPQGARFRQLGSYVAWPVLVERLERKLGSFQQARWVDQCRRDISRHCLAGSERPKGIFTLTVPTGGGKTLASLRFALHHAHRWKMDRVIYVSPYISIADQNAQVVREVLEPKECDFASIVLEHHSNLTEEKESWRGSVLAENWDAPVVFTTAVQVLEALFGGGTRSVRRLHALTNAVVVFDEVQTIPFRTIHLFNNAVNFLVEQCGASVVLCTATQPLLHRVDAKKGAMRLNPDSELMPNSPQLFRDLKRYEAFDRTIKPGGWTAAEVSELSISEMLGHGSCLVIVNTKRDALAIYAKLKELVKSLEEPVEDGCLMHLTTHMCPAHRLESLNRMKAALAPQAGKQVLCVSTQLMEAGVDIDFATVVRDLAGLDSIAQAAGRCNRNGERATGRVHIVKMADALPKQLDEIACAQSNTSRVLNDWRDENGDQPFDLSNPQEMERFFKHHFFARAKQMDYPVKAPLVPRDDTLLRMLGENSLAVEDAKILGVKRSGLLQSFYTAGQAFRAIDCQTQGVVVPFGKKGLDLIAELCSTQNLASELRILRRAQRFTVNVFPHEMETLKRKDAVYEAQPGTGVLCLREEFYSNEFGLALDGGEITESLIA